MRVILGLHKELCGILSQDDLISSLEVKNKNKNKTTRGRWIEVRRRRNGHELWRGGWLNVCCEWLGGITNRWCSVMHVDMSELRGMLKLWDLLAMWCICLSLSRDIDRLPNELEERAWGAFSQSPVNRMPWLTVSEAIERSTKIITEDCRCSCL